MFAIPSAFKLSRVAREYKNIPFFCTLSHRDTLLLYTIIVKISENRQVCSLNQPHAFASNFDLRYERNFRSLGVAYSRRIRRAPTRLRAISVNSVPDLALTDRARVLKIENCPNKTQNTRHIHKGCLIFYKYSKRCEGSLCLLER